MRIYDSLTRSYFSFDYQADSDNTYSFIMEVRDESGNRFGLYTSLDILDELIQNLLSIRDTLATKNCTNTTEETDQLTES